MAVDDHGLEAIRKSAEEVTPGSKADYYLKTKIIDAIAGSFSPSGLSQEIKITTTTITDVATPLPATPLVGRNALSLRNKSLTETLYIGPSTVTADTVAGITSGWEVAPNGNIGFDITDDVILYARCETGKSAVVKIMELA